MERHEIEFHLENMAEWDEVDIVDSLRLTSQELLEAFEERAIKFIKENWE